MLKFVLIALNLIIFYKLHFYVNLITGNQAMIDFDAYHHLVNAAKAGINPYDAGSRYSFGPPLVYFYFVPFDLFPLSTARSIFTVINLLSGFSALWILTNSIVKKYKTEIFLSLSAVFFSSFPVRYSIENGQPIMVIVLLIVILLTTKNRMLKSIAVAGTVAIKTNFLFTFISIIRKNKKVAIMVTFLLLGAMLLTFTLIKPQWYSFYVQKKLGSVMDVNRTSGELDYYNQSFSGFLSRFSLPINNNLNIILLLLLGVYLLFSQNILFGIISSILFSPIAWQHYYAALFPVMVYVLLKMKKSKTNLIIFALASILWWTEFPSLHNTELNLVSAILASHYFISGALLAYLSLKSVAITTSK